MVGLATLTGSSRLILVGLGNLRFLQVNHGWAGHPDGFLQVDLLMRTQIMAFVLLYVKCTY